MARSQEKLPQTKPASGGGPPGPPKKTARDLADESPGDSHIDIPDPIVLKDLALTLQQKPFVIVADVIRLGVFAMANDPVAYEVAAKVAKKYGFEAHKVT